MIMFSYEIIFTKDILILEFICLAFRVLSTPLIFTIHPIQKADLDLGQLY